ncbi:MAG: restriction endonuclease subunit S [Gammaproteobacteria bacterium]|nr:restriction endonuclease subunit S [Gammaproteobacteria bacterium]MBU1481163.1 restriction endonuclease subunit S [Gammaproteobacteria bacterium]
MTMELKAREAPARYQVMLDVQRVRPGYKQTEVGVIPEDWDALPFAELFEFRNGVNADKASYGQGVRFINVLEPITYSHIYGPEITGQVTLPVAVATSYAVRRGDVLFNRTSETQDEVGLAATYLGTELVVFGGFVIRGRPTDQRFDPIYSGYALRAPIIRSQIIPMGQGAIRANIGQKNLSLVVTPVPPLPEQRAIAAALSDVDALLAKLDQLIAKKRDLKQAAMQQLLTGSTRLPGFSGEWEVKTIEELEKMGFVKLSRGKVISKKDIERHPGDCPIYSSSVKNDGLFGCYGEHMFDEELITWSVDGGGHFFHRAKHKFSVTNVCGFMRVDTSKLGYRFLAAQLQLLHSNLNFDYQDKAHPSVIRKAYSVFIPDLEEQTAIAAILSDMDTELAALEARRAKIRDLKQGMMQELLTGRIRLI